MEQNQSTGVVAAIRNETVETLVTYEERLDSDLNWAFEQGSRHFKNGSAVHRALRRIVRHLDQMNVRYAVAGGMALFFYGYRRFTEDVDIIVTRDDLRTIHNRLEGRGYLPAFSGSKHLRDTEFGVRIEFRIAGEFPGDGKPKPVAFPCPSDAAEKIDGLSCLRLNDLVELKLASGMTSPGRARDLGDVQALIETLNLKREFADSLNAYVRTTYDELWDAVFTGRRWFKTIRPDQPLTVDVGSIDDLIAVCPESTEELDAMKADGVEVELPRTDRDGLLYLVTTDPEVAARYEMHPESEFMDEPDSEAEQN